MIRIPKMSRAALAEIIHNPTGQRGRALHKTLNCPCFEALARAHALGYDGTACVLQEEAMNHLGELPVQAQKHRSLARSD